MDQPTKLTERTGAKKSDSSTFRGDREHRSIIKDTLYLCAFGRSSMQNILIERYHDARYRVRIPLD